MRFVPYESGWRLWIWLRSWSRFIWFWGLSPFLLAGTREDVDRTRSDPSFCLLFAFLCSSLLLDFLLLLCLFEKKGRRSCSWSLTSSSLVVSHPKLIIVASLREVLQLQHMHKDLFIFILRFINSFLGCETEVILALLILMNYLDLILIVSVLEIRDLRISSLLAVDIYDCFLNDLQGGRIIVRGSLSLQLVFLQLSEQLSSCLLWVGENLVDLLKLFPNGRVPPSEETRLVVLISRHVHSVLHNNR